MNADIDALISSADCWETVGYLGAVMVLLGVVIEAADLLGHNFPKLKFKREKQILVIGFLFVVGGLAIEFWGTYKANSINGLIIASLNTRSSEAVKKAGELGVTVDTLDSFVKSKTNETNNAIAQLNLIIAQANAKASQALANQSHTAGQ